MFGLFLAYLFYVEVRENTVMYKVHTATFLLKVPYIYNKTKTIYKQLEFLHTEVAIKRYSLK